MAYVSPNYSSKKALKEAIASGATVRVFQPNRMCGSDAEFNGRSDVAVEGPHYPKPHKWYGTATVDATGKVTSVR